MELPSQKISAETIEETWRREMQQLASAGTVKRLWEKDESLWPHTKEQKRLIANNLNWLDLPDHIGPYMMRAAALATSRPSVALRLGMTIATRRSLRPSPYPEMADTSR